MLRQILTNDVSTIKRHILNHTQGHGPMVVARIAGWPGTPQIYAVREEMYPVTSSLELQVQCQHLGLPLLPRMPKRWEVQIHPLRHQPWHIAQAFYLKTDDEVG